VIFSIILGISLGVTKNPNVPTALGFFDAIFSAFLRYVNGLMYGLPIGLFFLISTFVSKVGLGTLTSLFDLILCLYISVFIIFTVLLFIISWKSKTPLLRCLQLLKNPYLIAFGTSSSFAAMPAAMLALRDSFKVEKQNIELVMPLGVSLFKPGIMIRSVIISYFLMNLYQVPINVTSIGILILTSVICSIATTAGPAILSATMFSMVLTPLGIPASVGIFLLLSVEPMVDPITTVLNIQSNCAVTLMVTKKRTIF
jgi:proton glutamate symport protein